MQTRQNVEKNIKCGDFLSDARGNAKLMIHFFGPYPGHFTLGPSVFPTGHSLTVCRNYSQHPTCSLAVS